MDFIFNRAVGSREYGSAKIGFSPAATPLFVILYSTSITYLCDLSAPIDFIFNRAVGFKRECRSGTIICNWIFPAASLTWTASCNCAAATSPSQIPTLWIAAQTHSHTCE